MLNVDNFRKGLAKGVEWFNPDFISKLQGVDLMEALPCGVMHLVKHRGTGIIESSTSHSCGALEEFSSSRLWLDEVSFWDSLSL